MNTLDPGVGFFGKVRSHGDFVTRRLPSRFTLLWDDWLQGVLRASQATLGPTWLTTYLNSPIWRFALAPGVCGEAAWAGVLMPSVDRVGRHFPLTVAGGSTATAPLFDWVAEEGAWYDQIETLALSSLREDFSLDIFDASLGSMALPPGGSGVNGETCVVAKGHLMALGGLDQLRDAVPRLSHAIATASLKGHSLWWTDGSQQVAPCVLVHEGLPTTSLFTAMLDGRWASHENRSSGAQ